MGGVVLEKYNFYSGIYAGDYLRVRNFFQILLKYSNENVVICGRFAICYWAHKLGEFCSTRPVNDVDVVVKALEDISPRVVPKMLLVYKIRSYMALKVHPIGIKVDVFTDYYPEDWETETVLFEGKPIKIVTLYRQFTKTVFDCYRVKYEPIDTKQFVDAANMRHWIERIPGGKEQVTKSWDFHFRDVTGLSWEQAYAEALLTRERKPENVIPDLYKKKNNFAVKLMASIVFGVYTLLKWGMRSSSW